MLMFTAVTSNTLRDAWAPVEPRIFYAKYLAEYDQ